MHSDEIKPGDTLSENGQLVYTVEQVEVRRPHIVALVRYADGGLGNRMWEIGKPVPLTRGA